MIDSIAPIELPQSWGWYVVGLFIVWQLYAPKFGVETRVETFVRRIEARIERINQTQRELTQVVKALADVVEGMDESEVHDHLDDNGKGPEDFIDADDYYDQQRFSPGDD